MNDEKMAAIKRVMRQARLEAAAAQLRVPGPFGACMAYGILKRAEHHVFHIMTSTPSDGTGQVIGPNFRRADNEGASRD